jgi:5-methylcytosine-specific restriction protein A
MTYEPLRICRDCQRTTLPGSPHCADHQTENRAARESAERNRRRRDNPLKRFYDNAQWRKRTVPYVLQRDPLCKLAIVCGGDGFSTEVDHIVRAEVYVAQHDGDTRAFFDPDNLRGVCHRCHSHKTALEDAGRWAENATD